jgi:DNA-binding CsgD family transcriptional regulator/tetratricopeptide (TPR) repeat protein
VRLGFRVHHGRIVSTASSSVTVGDLLERAEERAALDDGLEAVKDDAKGRIVLVGGEAGVGKTTFVRRFCDESRSSARILWGACDPLFTPRPLGPLLVLAEDIGEEVAAVLDSGARPHEVVTALARELRLRAPTVFVLEDMHWADEATFDLLRLLARRVETVPVLVVASYRDDELDARHPLRVMIGELATNRSVERVKLDPLSLAAVTELADAHGVDGDELYRKTAGNPFFVVEALAAGGQEIPDTVRDVVLARAARLSDGARALLEAVAVVPPRAELWLLEALAGAAVESLDECVTSGMLTFGPTGIAFRHELGRLAVEESIAPTHRLRLHRTTLATLAGHMEGSADLARLAHHAEAAGDREAVLRFAPAAAARAASLGAHREAVAQYRRALRFGDDLPLAERAELLERCAASCLWTDQYDVGIASLEDELECRRALGDTLREGDALRRLSEFLWCPGRTAECQATAGEAVALLESIPPSRALGHAYVNLAFTCGARAANDEANDWSRRALELAQLLGDGEIEVHARVALGECDPIEGRGEIEASLERAQARDLTLPVGRAFLGFAARSLEDRDVVAARRYIDAGLAFCSDRGLELYRLYLLADRARLELSEGRWTEAADAAESVLRIPRTSTTPRILALVVLGLVRARRGDPGHVAALAEAWALAEPTAELPRLGPVAVARAETAWLAGDPDAVAQATDTVLARAREARVHWLADELEAWRTRAGLDGSRAGGGDWAVDRERWLAVGYPYEAALALAEADEEEPLRLALRELHQLGAKPAAAIVARRLRELGARGVPRGPRAATRGNAANLSPRELEVLELLVDGLRNKEIATRLVLSERTVDHHVGAILRKLEVRTRGEATAEASRLGITAQDR